MNFDNMMPKEPMGGDPYKAAYNLMATARNELAAELNTVRAYLKFHVGRPGKEKPFDALIASITAALQEYGPSE